MKKVAILVPESSVVQATADPQYCFNAVNQFMQMSGKDPLFDIHLVGTRAAVELGDGHYTIHVDSVISNPDVYDLVFIPAIFGDLEQALERNARNIAWLKMQYEQGAELASLCLGAFLLASTGLLEGKKCSTHWGFQEQFKKLFPNVEVQEGNIITEEHRIYSSGGATSYWNLLIHLVEKYADRATAILIAKYFAIDIERDNQSLFAIFQGQKNHHDEPILQAQDLIENNIESKLTIEEIAEKVALGRRSLERRFRQATNNSVLEYIQRVKMEAAKRRFENSHKNINEVMLEVGYTDDKAFRTTFKKITGLTPVEYRKKYQKN